MNGCVAEIRLVITALAVSSELVAVVPVNSKRHGRKGPRVEIRKTST
jgi:hypothetical protein